MLCTRTTRRSSQPSRRASPHTHLHTWMEGGGRREGRGGEEKGEEGRGGEIKGRGRQGEGIEGEGEERKEGSKSYASTLYICMHMYQNVFFKILQLHTYMYTCTEHCLGARENTGVRYIHARDKPSGSTILTIPSFSSAVEKAFSRFSRGRSGSHSS